MHLAVHAPNYETDEFVVRWINNVGPHVEKIYLAYPERPWGYNPEARETKKNGANPELIQESQYADKVEIVRGDWLTEEETRNECLERARSAGMDYLIVQDLDEFYTPEEFQKNVEGLKANPDACSYRAPWQIFWRDVRHVIRFREITVRGENGEVLFNEKEGTTDYMVAFAMNCNSPVSFARKRCPSHLDSFVLLEGLCCHLSLVLSDEAVLRKISTWGHANEMKRGWYRFKWEAWREGVKNIGLTNPAFYMEAVRFEGQLPAEIEDFAVKSQVVTPLSLNESISQCLYDIKHYLYYHYRAIRSRLRRG